MQDFHNIRAWRAAHSLAEGAGAATNAEFARYLDMSIKSSSELENQIERAHGYGLTRDDERAQLINDVCEVRKMTWGLRKAVLRQKPPRPTTDTENG